MRRLAIAMLVLLLLVLGVRLALRPAIRSDPFRARVERWASDGLGVDVTIDEPIDPAISLLPGLEMSGVRFANPADASWWLAAKADSLSLRIRLRPLFLGRLETRLRAEGVDVRFALAPDESDAPSSFDLSALIRRLPEARVRNATVVEGRRGEEEGLHLRITDASLRGCDGHLEFDGEVGGVALVVDTELLCEGPRSLHFGELAAEFAGLPFEGELALSFGSPRTRLAGSLHADRLDVADLDPPEPRSGESVSWLDRALPYGRLDRVDLDLALALDEFVAENRRFREASFDAKLLAGKLGLEARAGLDEGSVAATLRAGASGEALGLKLELRDLPLRHLYANDAAKGLYALDLELAGTGDTPRQVLASSSGALHFRLGESHLPESLLGPLGKDIAGVLSSQFRSAQPTRFECGVLRSEFRAGLGTPTAMVVDMPEMTLAGGGLIDLRRLHLDLRLRPRPKHTSIVALKTPLHIVGPFEDLSAGLDTAEMARITGRLVTEGLLDPRKVASVFVDLGSDIADPCEVDLEQAARERSSSPLRATGAAVRGVGSWVFGIFGGEAKPPGAPDEPADPAETDSPVVPPAP
jgi:hypothetical protein